MKKLRLILSGAAILLACGGAVAKHSFDCSYSTQYYYNGTTYIEAGVFGEDFTCLNLPGVCSYYEVDPIFHPGVFAPCHYGQYLSASQKTQSRDH
ncbi:MAG: hypothetical protein JST39_24875 [Bacteroidetes bacterium]|nr:hypothetical protein [Bacteroidota bacterium]